MSISLVMIIGLLGSFIMFIGDMALYYNKNDYVADGTLQPIIEIMKQESRFRLYIGGILGPLAAFLYCIGYYHAVLMTNQSASIFGWLCFLVNCAGIICGGAYHSHCANLGLISRHDDEACLEEVLLFLDAQKKVAFGLQAIGFLILAVLIFAGCTALPRWAGILTPGVLVLLTPLMRKLPKGLHMIICGGWTNLISVIYYIVALLILCK